ncbi:MAG: transposase [Bradyrhizobium sp.]
MTPGSSASVVLKTASFRSDREARGAGGLVGAPFSSGNNEREQGISKDGTHRLRVAMVELAWLWVRWQPDSALSVWFRKAGGRVRKIMIVALARELLVALWRFAKNGAIPYGAKMKAA